VFLVFSLTLKTTVNYVLKNISIIIVGYLYVCDKLNFEFNKKNRNADGVLSSIVFKLI